MPDIKTISQDDLFNLELIQKDKVSDVLFLIGTLIAMYVNSKAEQKILCPEVTQASGDSAVAQATTINELVIVVVLLFLAATIILAYTSSTRLSKLKAEKGKTADQTVINNISGNELVVLGFLIRIVGYITSYVGNRIRADNPI
ncbi:MAG TPA: hypothetical protein VEB00_07625 [Clostridia bacterium]|nr:hypothetical protein [Clostridia bacterium]